MTAIGVLVASLLPVPMSPPAMAADPPLVVVPVPANPDLSTPGWHAAYPGAEITLKAVARTTAPAVWYRWDADGDGTFEPSPNTGSPWLQAPCVAGSCNLELNWTYNALPSKPFAVYLATVAVTLSASTAEPPAFGTFPVVVRQDVPSWSTPQIATPDQLAVMTRLAFDEGLWRMHRQLVRAGTGATGTAYLPGPNGVDNTAMALWAFAAAGHRPAYEPGTYTGAAPAGWAVLNAQRWSMDPYADDVARLRNYLLARLAQVSVPAAAEANDGASAIAGTDDGKGLALGVASGASTYPTARLLGALAAIGPDPTIAQVGPAGVTGRTQDAIAQEVIDTLAHAQIASGHDLGGFGYYAGYSEHWAEYGNWPLLALPRAAVALDDAGVHVPAIVRERLAAFLVHNQASSGLARMADMSSGSLAQTGGVLAAAAWLGWPELTPGGTEVIATDADGNPITDGAAATAYARYLRALWEQWETYQSDIGGPAGLFDAANAPNGEPFMRTDGRASAEAILEIGMGLDALAPNGGVLGPDGIVPQAQAAHDWHRQFAIYLVRAQSNQATPSGAFTGWVDRWGTPWWLDNPETDTMAILSLAQTNNGPIADDEVTYAATVGETLDVDAEHGVLARMRDADGDPLATLASSYSLLGDLHVATDGSFTYQPTEAAAGQSLPISLPVSDGRGGVGIARVRFAVTAGPRVPDAPAIESATGTLAGLAMTVSPPVSDGGSPITGYEASCVNDGVEVTADSASVSISFDRLMPGVWTCRARAVNAVGPGPWSSAADVTPLAATLTVTARDATALVGDPMPALAWDIDGLLPGDDADALVIACTTTAPVASGLLSTAGTYPIACEITDAPAYYATASVPGHLAVSPRYTFEGFKSPVDAMPTVNTMKAGAAVPVKWSLGADLGLDILAAGSPSSRRVACDTGAAIDAIEETVTAGASGLRYDAVAAQYIYTWKTDKSWSGTCRVLTLTLSGGDHHEALFKFTK